MNQHQEVGAKMIQTFIEQDGTKRARKQILYDWDRLIIEGL